MSQATAQISTNIVKLPVRRKRKAKAKRTRQPRRPDPVTTMKTLYEWRDARREYDRQLSAIKREQRWGGVRSLGLLLAMSIVLVGLLVIGVLSGA